MSFPQLFSSEEIDRRIAENRQPQQEKQANLLSDPEQFIHSIAALSAKYPNISGRIETTWGTAELQSYLDDLIMGAHHESGEVREGFPPVIMNHLLQLHRLNFKVMGAVVNYQMWRG